jgi:protein phosphatase
VLVGLVWVGGAAAWSWTQQQYYVGEHEGVVTIYRGVNADLPGVALSTPYETTDLEMDSLSEYDRGQVEEGIGAGDLASARRTVDNLVAEDATGSAGG